MVQISVAQISVVQISGIHSYGGYCIVHGRYLGKYPGIVKCGTNHVVQISVVQLSVVQIGVYF